MPGVLLSREAHEHISEYAAKLYGHVSDFWWHISDKHNVRALTEPAVRRNKKVWAQVHIEMHRQHEVGRRAGPAEPA